jgi:hypothetical protein
VVDALLRSIDIHNEPVTLVVHQLWQLGHAATRVQDNGTISWDVLGDYISNTLVVLNPFEISLVPIIRLGDILWGKWGSYPL